MEDVTVEVVDVVESDVAGAEAEGDGDAGVVVVGGHCQRHVVGLYVGHDHEETTLRRTRQHWQRQEGSRRDEPNGHRTREPSLTN